MTLPSFTRRAFLVPVLFLATLVGFSQANEASAQSLQGTWEFTWYEVTSPDVPMGTITVTVDKKAKSFSTYQGNKSTLASYVALKINPSKNTFEGTVAEDFFGNIGGFAGAGIVNSNRNFIIGAGLAFSGVEEISPVVSPTGPPVVFVGIKQ